MEFDSNRALKEGVIIWYIRKSLKYSVRVEIKQGSRKFDSFEGMVEKPINAEANTALRPCSYTCEIDQYYV